MNGIIREQDEEGEGQIGKGRTSKEGETRKKKRWFQADYLHRPLCMSGHLCRDTKERVHLRV